MHIIYHAWSVILSCQCVKENGLLSSLYLVLAKIKRTHPHVSWYWRVRIQHSAQSCWKWDHWSATLLGSRLAVTAKRDCTPTVNLNDWRWKYSTDKVVILFLLPPFCLHFCVEFYLMHGMLQSLLQEVQLAAILQLSRTMDIHNKIENRTDSKGIK